MPLINQGYPHLIPVFDKCSLGSPIFISQPDKYSVSCLRCFSCEPPPVSTIPQVTICQAGNIDLMGWRIPESFHPLPDNSYKHFHRDFLAALSFRPGINDHIVSDFLRQMYIRAELWYFRQFVLKFTSLLDIFLVMISPPKGITAVWPIAPSTKCEWCLSFLRYLPGQLLTAFLLRSTAAAAMGCMITFTFSPLLQ